MRASQIPARYVHGTIDVPIEQFKNWAGWFSDAQAAGHYASSGGIPIVGIIEGDALANDFLASGTVNESEGWISGFDPAVLQSAQANAQTVLQDHINTNLPNATVGDVIGGKKIIEQTAPGLPSSLPNAIKVKGASYATIPQALQASVTITLGRDSLNQPTGQITLPWATVNNHKLTLSYQPASAEDEATLQSYLPEGEITDISQLPNSLPGYLINVIPQLKLNGDIISQGQPLALGEELNLEYKLTLPTHGSRSFNSSVVAGSFQVLMTVGGSVSSSGLEKVQARLIELREILNSNNPSEFSKVSRDSFMGNMFFAGSLGYFSQYTSLSEVAGIQQKIEQDLLISIGTFGYIPNVNILFGFPRSIETGGVEMDIDNITIFVSSSEANNNDKLKYNKQIGILSSVLEHSIPEQIFNIDPLQQVHGISAVKALALASSQSQRIYEINEINLDEVLPKLTHETDVLNEIKTSVLIGKNIVVHEMPVSIYGWSGAGYVIFDPETGDGAYKISGGSNGSVLKKIPAKLNKLFFWAGAFLAIFALLISIIVAIIAVLISLIQNLYDLITICASLAFAITISLVLLFVDIIVEALIILSGIGLLFEAVIAAGLIYLNNLVIDWAKNTLLCTRQ